MEEVVKWINSAQDYKTGAWLYNIHGTNARLKALFLKNETAYNREKLLLEMKALARSAPAPSKTSEGGVMKVIYVAPSEHLSPSASSASDDLWELYKDLDIERNKLSNQYHALKNAKASKEEFARHYQKIEEKSKEMLEVWDRIHNRQKGQDFEDDVDSLKKEKRRVIDQKSKLKKKLENYIKLPEGCAKRILMEKQVAVLSAQYENVMQKLKGK